MAQTVVQYLPYCAIITSLHKPFHCISGKGCVFAIRNSKTYESWDLLIVTHITIGQSISTAERTGCGDIDRNVAVPL